MFERYTETARRAIFFARYEASQFVSPYIETEHLMLGLFREDKPLANRFLGSHAAVESLRKQVEAHVQIREKVGTSVDLPLSHECKRVLAYGAEESERFKHKQISTIHLLLGLLRDEKTFAAKVLSERGLQLQPVRAEAQQSQAAHLAGDSGLSASVGQWLAEREARGGIWSDMQSRGANSTTDFAVYRGDPPAEEENGDAEDPSKKLLQIQKRLRSIVGALENAIANHEFEQARSFSDEEHKERDNLRQLMEQCNLEEQPPPVPLLRVVVISNDRLADVQERCDRYLAAGVSQVWILDPNSKRAYTATQMEGLREVKDEILRIADPLLEMDLKKIFA